MRPTTVLFRAVLVAALATSGWACGYSLAGRGSFLPADIKRIGIPEFANRTTIFNLESQLTQKVRSEFIGRGRYEIVPESTGVDALLTGEVSNASIMPESFTAQQLATRYSLAVTARVELRDLRTNMVLWENPGLIFRQVYDAPNVGGNPTDASAFFAQDMNALDRMSSDFARTIVSAILEAF